jgi:hypothetical protein
LIMKNTEKFVCLLVLSGILFSQSAISSDQFGRFFTTSAQRTHMDELRKAKPAFKVEFEEQLIDIDEDVEVVEETPVNALTVRGLVYRSDGKSTAWINDSNTFEGNVSSQYISVGDIEADKVQIKVPSANTIVNLNVGQTFDPVSENYKDLLNESETTVNDASHSEN